MQARHQDFQEETDTCHLDVLYTGDQLTITLRDFTDWTIYSKQYTEDDIGGEIDCTMGLTDVFNAFCLGTIPEVLNGFWKFKHY